MSNPIAALKAKSLASVTPRDPRATSAPAADSSSSSPDRDWPSKWPDPSPCPTCLSPGFWIDVYGGGPHCRGCNPPSSPSLASHAVWVIGTPGEYRWIRNPKADGEHSHSLAGHTDDSGEWVTWRLPGGETITALRERIDPTRTGNPQIMPTGIHGTGKLIEVRRYSPALACGPVGDLTFDEWWNRLPELPSG